MYSHFEVKRLSRSLEKNFAVLASQFIDTLNGSSTSVRPVDHVIKHSHGERTGHLRQLEQLQKQIKCIYTYNDTCMNASYLIDKNKGGPIMLYTHYILKPIIFYLPT